MGRLIDEDILVKRIYEYRSNAIATEDVIHSIKTMPTAYDVGKAERQIKDYFCKVIDECEGNEVPHEILAYNKAVCEIVRKGGVE